MIGWAMEQHREAPRGYRFGVFEVECAAAALRRDGTLVRLRGKPFDILQFLLERPGDLVTRDELRHHLWPADTFVDFDHGLNAAMNRLRDALGDSADNPRFIQTLPRRGYRFIAPVERLPQAPPPALARPVPEPEPLALPAEPGAPAPVRPQRDAGRRWVVAAVVSALAAAIAATAWWAQPSSWRGAARTRPMLAVLPFENLSGSPDQAYFSDGFTDELIGQLGALTPEALGVIARTTVSRYRDGRQSVAEIGRTLDVDYVLEGSIRRAGDQVRITAQLIDVRSQTQLWAASYDHDVRDVLMAQRDVAMKVADSLTMSVLRVSAARPMPSPAAYDATLRGKALRQQATETSLARAQQYFAEAIALDPSYAAAHAGLADAWLVLGSPGWEFERPRDVLAKALDSARRAIELDPRLSDGYAVRGMARLWLDGDVRGAEEDLRQAIALNASAALAHQYLSTVLIVSGRNDDAVASARRGLQLDPLSPSSGTTVAYRLYYAGRFEEALHEFDRAIEGTPDYTSAWIGKAQAYRALGRARESRAALAAAERRSGGRTYVRAYRAYSLGVDGELAEARAIQAELSALAATRYVSPFNFALMAAGLGDGAEVRRQIARLAADGSGWTVFVPIERELAPFLGPTSRRAPGRDVPALRLAIALTSSSGTSSGSGASGSPNATRPAATVALYRRR
jgi:TolB-like protein/DNA-binding winged helix-turn-helix (wHTH) protein/Tfp pilus assembly protein PilF